MNLFRIKLLLFLFLGALHTVVIAQTLPSPVARRTSVSSQPNHQDLAGFRNDGYNPNSEPSWVKPSFVGADGQLNIHAPGDLVLPQRIDYSVTYLPAGDECPGNSIPCRSID